MGRCRDCLWWEFYLLDKDDLIYLEEEFRECTVSTYKTEIVTKWASGTENFYFVTAADFGCVLFEKRSKSAKGRAKHD